MPQKITEIKVFISCPSDLEKEKDVVIDVCVSLSRMLSHRRISLKPIYWQKDVVPIITGEIPQKIIDRHLGDSDYDIYFGILWRKFGDPLENSLTPTESEFENAFQRYKKEKRPLITFFFKKKELPPKNQYETNQISAVQSFSDRLKNIGLYKPFVNELDFQKISYETIHKFVLKLTETEDVKVTCIRIKYDKVSNYLSRKVTPLETFKPELRYYNLGIEKYGLIELLEKENRIVLVGEAGVGKTIELKRVASIFSQDESKFFPVLINLNKYVDHRIEDFLPDNWDTIPEYKLLLILDGLDEIESKNKRDAIRRIELFSEQYPASTIIASCRANFYQFGSSNSSGTLRGFKALTLLPIEYAQVESYLEENLNTNRGDFLDKIYELQLFDLLYNPFYLFELVKLYNSEKRLPDNRADLFGNFIALKIDSDESHYRTTIDLKNDRPILLKSLKKIALCSETLGRNYISDYELNKIITDAHVRELLKHCSLINKAEGDAKTWQFEHNSIQEYLSASILSQQPIEVIKSFIAFAPDYIKIIPSWLNAVSFLFSFLPKGQFINWIMEKEPEITVKFEPDKINDHSRIQIFQNIFNSYKKKQIWIDRDKYSYDELARFGQHPDNIKFLINEIDSASHYTTIGNAIEILGRMQIHSDYSDRLSRLLIKVAIDNFRLKIPEHIQQDALMAMSDLGYNSKKIVDLIVTKLKYSKSDWIRYGLYYFLHNSDFLDDNIDIFLDGIIYVRFDLHDISGRRSRLMNEKSELIKGLKKVSSKDSLKKLLNYCISNDRDIHDLFMGNHDIRFLAINSAKVYEGHPELFDPSLEFALKLYENHHNDEAKQFNIFFERTKTQSIAFKKVLSRESHYKEEFLADIADSDCIQYLLQEYEKGSIDDKNVWRILHTFQWRNKEMFEFLHRSLNDKYKSKFIIKPPLDWEKIRKEKRQRDFDLLFDKTKFMAEIKLIYQKEHKVSFTQDELFDLRKKQWPEEPYSDLAIRTLRRLTGENSITFDGAVEKINEYDWDWFAISHVYERLESNSELIVSDAQKEWIENWCLFREKQVDFKTAITKNSDNSFSVRWDAIYLWFFYRQFEFGYAKTTLLDMLSFDHQRKGIEYLEKALSKRDITKRILKNLNDGIKISDVLKNHLEYCSKNNIKEVLPFAFVQIKDEKAENEIRRISLEAILNINNDLKDLEIALYEIKDSFNWEVIEKLIDKSERIYDYLRVLFQESASEDKVKLCDYLINFQDVDALAYYVGWIKDQNRFDRQMYNASYLSKLKTEEAIPHLIELLEVTYQKEFQQSDQFDRLDRLVLEAFKSISLESRNNYLTVKQAIETFISKNIKAYKNVNWLYSFLSQLEQQYYVNKSQNITIDDVLEKLKLISFN